MNKPTKDEILARIVLLIASFIWGTTFVVISSTNDFFRPAFLVFMRCAIAVFILCLVFIKRIKKLTRNYFRTASMLAGFMTGGYLLQGIAMTDAGCPPGRCGFLVATYCVITPFISWIIEKRQPHRYNIVAAVICMAGIVCLSLPDLLNENAVAVNIGDLLALSGSVTFSIYLVYVARYMKNLDPILFTITNLFFAALYAGLYTLFFEDNSRIIWNTQSITAVAYLGVVCMALTNLLQAIGQRNAPASTAALIFSLESVFGIIFAIAVWHENVTPLLLIGCSLIFIAILISETKLSFLKSRLSRAVFKKFFS